MKCAFLLFNTVVTMTLVINSRYEMMVIVNEMSTFNALKVDME